MRSILTPGWLREEVDKASKRVDQMSKPTAPTKLDTAMGVEIWVDPNMPFNHIETRDKAGHILTYEGGVRRITIGSGTQ